MAESLGTLSSAKFGGEIIENEWTGISALATSREAIERGRTADGGRR